MNPADDAPLDSTDPFGLLSRHRRFVLSATAMSFACFLLAAYTLPRKYKAHFVLSIYAKYFQNPLLRDFLPEVSDSAEMHAQREALIRQALTVDFLDSLGERYGIYQTGSAPRFSAMISRVKAVAEAWGMGQSSVDVSRRTLERELLRSRIDVMSLNVDTFQISFVDSDPDVTFRATRDIYAQVVRTLAELRTSALVNVRDAISKRMESLALNAASGDAPRAAVRPQLVREELTDVQNQIRELTAQFTEEHPAVKELRRRERTLLHLLQAGPRASLELPFHPGGAAAGAEPDASSRDIYEDLARKTHYLDITLDSDKTPQADYLAVLEPPLYPAGPIWPKKSLFALWGLAVGLIGSLAVCSIWEYFERSALHAESLARHLGVPLLGELPTLPQINRAVEE